MNINDLNTLEQLELFLTGNQSVAFLAASNKDECYRGIQRTLVKCGLAAKKLCERAYYILTNRNTSG